jgi:peptidyl-tRNA hydrolase, PTH2 family
MTELKQVMLVRDDLKLPKGKMAVQVAHASVNAVLISEKEMVRGWQDEGCKKIVLKVADMKELQRYFRFAKEAGLVAVMITDAGLTTVPPGTTTCAGIGPDDAEKIDRLTGNLKMM